NPTPLPIRTPLPNLLATARHSARRISVSSSPSPWANRAYWSSKAAGSYFARRCFESSISNDGSFSTLRLPWTDATIRPDFLGVVVDIGLEVPSSRFQVPKSNTIPGRPLTPGTLELGTWNLELHLSPFR